MSSLNNFIAFLCLVSLPVFATNFKGHQTQTTDEGADFKVGPLENLAVNCPSPNVLKQFGLAREVRNGGSSGQIGYHYTCTEGLQEAPLKTHGTPWASEGDGSTYFLDRQFVACEPSEAMTGFKLVRDNGKMRYEYGCRNVQLVDLSNFETDFADDGKGKSIFLDRHSPNCPGDKPLLNAFRLIRNPSGDKIKYVYKCGRQANELRRDAKVVSLGYKCTTRYNIEHNYLQAQGGMESNFFDWIFSDSFDEVMMILSWAFDSGAYDRTFSKLEMIPTDTGTEKYYAIRPLEFTYIKSIHDVYFGEEEKIADPVKRKEAIDAKIKKDFFSKYKRRLARLFDQIREKKPIFFVRWTSDQDNLQLTDRQVREFHKLMARIAPQNQHLLVNVSLLDAPFNAAQLESECHFKFFNLSRYPLLKDKPSQDWCQDHRDWRSVFKWMESVNFANLSSNEKCIR